MAAGNSRAPQKAGPPGELGAGDHDRQALLQGRGEYRRPGSATGRHRPRPAPARSGAPGFAPPAARLTPGRPVLEASSTCNRAKAPAATARSTFSAASRSTSAWAQSAPQDERISTVSSATSASSPPRQALGLGDGAAERSAVEEVGAAGGGGHARPGLGRRDHDVGDGAPRRGEARGRARPVSASVPDAASTASAPGAP